MYSPMSLEGLQTILVSHSTVVPVAGGAFAGLALAVFRRTGSLAIPFGVRDSRSLMNFSSLGTLRCVCGSQHREGAIADRRHFCRDCGCEVVAQNREMLSKELSRRDIKQMTRSLRRAARRASHLEIPPSITTVDELHRYLDSSEPKDHRTPPTQPTSVGQPQVH